MDRVASPGSSSTAIEGRVQAWVSNSTAVRAMESHPHHARKIPGRPAVKILLQLWLNQGLSWSMVACCFELLGSAGFVISTVYPPLVTFRAWPQKVPSAGLWSSSRGRFWEARGGPQSPGEGIEMSPVEFRVIARVPWIRTSEDYRTVRVLHF